MGHVVFAAPTIESIHLHEQLARKLLRREHRLTLLTTDPAEQRCFTLHGLPGRELRRSRGGEHPRIPIEEFAQRDCRLAGLARPGLAQLRRQVRRLQQHVGGLLRFFETESPDLIVLHRARSGLHRLIHFVAREFGCQILHLGEGFLPGTMQWDDEGVDGDSSTCRRDASFYRHEDRDEGFLASALAAVVGDATPPALPQRTVYAPDLLDRLLCLCESIGRARLVGAVSNLRSWQRMSRPWRTPATAPARLPDEPFVAVLLQPPGCPRILLDCVDAPGQARLVCATQAAVWALNSTMPVVVVPPAAGMGRDQLAHLRQRPPGIFLAEPDAAAAAACTAAALVTINHPRAFTGILAGTPVVHLGRSPYAIAGIATSTCLDHLPRDLAAAMRRDHRTLRERFATRMLVHDHVWCNADAPDPNGVRGLVVEIERRLARASRPTDALRYRPGPIWPLASSSEAL
jgi:hypothetical protein